MVLGVLAAIIVFTYAGYLYITGIEGNIKKAKSIFPKVFLGFVIMLVAWFVVYQLLSWLTGNSGFAKLLGNP
jgi:membrane protein DedA with SNARE-associated domain